MAAVILPASILSNSNESYIGARESLLENFKIRAIVQFGSKTFGATGTNTVVMFLEKYDEPPKRMEMVKDSAEAILSGAEVTDWEDQNILNGYFGKIEVSEDDYRSFCSKIKPFVNWREHTYFGQYVKAFENRKQVKGDVQAQFYQYALDIEYEKLRFFALTYNQTTMVVTAPADNDEQKEFLGYDWSNRKGAEGIHISNRGGKLYCNADRYAENTTASLIRSAFMKNADVPSGLEEYCAWHDLQDMIDFSRAEFNKEIKPSLAKKFVVKSKWPIVNLSHVFSSIESGSRPRGGVGSIKDGVLSIGGEHIDNQDGHLHLESKKYVSEDFYLESSKGKIKQGDILVCKDGALSGKIAIVGNEIAGERAMVNEHVFILRCLNLFQQQYLFNYLYLPTGQKLLQSAVTGAAQGGINISSISKLSIPLPPLDVQQKIVEECSAVDFACDKARREIKASQEFVLGLYNNLTEAKKIPLNKLVSFNASRAEIAHLNDNLEISFVDMASVNNDGYIETFQKRKLSEVRKGGYTYFRENEIIIAKITPCMENGKCALARGLLNEIGFGSTEFHTIRCGKNILPEFLFHFLNRESIRQAAAKQMTGASGHRRVPITFYENIEIPLVPLGQQSEIVRKIEHAQETIKECKEKLIKTQEKKQAILDKWL